jgi:RNA polymerase sigma factor for flagellar operon FliA
MTFFTQSLWVRYRTSGDPDARARLLDQYLGLVHHVARDVAGRVPQAVELDDLVSAGTLGLVRALEAFDETRGLEFSTYATPCIRGAILDDLRERDWAPRSVREKRRRVAAAVAEVEQRRGRAAREPEVAKALGIDLPTFWRWRRDIDSATLEAFDQPEEEGSHDALARGDILAGRDALGADHDLAQAEQLAAVREALGALPEKERVVLSLYYYEELTLRQIGEVLHLGESRISQIRSAALQHLRSILPSAQRRL